MTRRLALLIVTSAAFVGWLAWLAVAVLAKDKPDIVSRAQLTEANVVIIGEVTRPHKGVDDPPVTVSEVLLPLDLPEADADKLRKLAPPVGATIHVGGLTAARVPGRAVWGDGLYLLPLIRIGDSAYQIAGLPRSPGYEAVRPEPGVVYPWTPDVQAQMKKLKYLP